MTLSGKMFAFALGLLLFNFLQNANGQAVGDNYYRAFTEQRVNWYRAFQMCAYFGMRLATVENESDWNELRTALFSKSSVFNNYWLGGHNMGSRNEYNWLTTGHKFAFTKWASNQPGSLANRCVRTDFNFDWETDSCTNLNYFICSKPLVSSCGPYGGCANKGISFLYEY